MQISDALKKILNGESVPTTGQFRTALGQLYDFLTGIVGTDTTDPATLQSLLGQVAHHGQCQLVKSGANLVLKPLNGNKLMVGGKMRTIPAAGVSMTADGLTPGARYYIYVYMDGDTMTLRPSTTGHITYADSGVEVKSDAGSNTLVGQVRIVAGPAFQDTPAQRFVRSWFNDPGISCLNWFTATRSTASPSYVELSSEIRIEFLTWLGEIIHFGGAGGSSQTNSGVVNATAVSIDGVQPELGSWSGAYMPINNFGVPFSTSFFKAGLTEGYHYATLVARVVGSGTGNWSGGTPTSSNPEVCTLAAAIPG
ncbi:hypothetical protein [Herbaspirillum frisingense]|uniref:Uncharacterized protein n=1 Tax=Herbaspirillum frisingense TaxID=92645 RepID=A0ABU1PHX3_9BURK|nr:hypothetical protein [Herbaspirillum frisingense]MDR6585519.1 hypothetical protein [Herbaspirillum frisingense]